MFVKSLKICFALVTLLVFGYNRTFALSQINYEMITDYFVHKKVKQVGYLSCETPYQNNVLVKRFISLNMMVSVSRIDQGPAVVERRLRQWNVAVGVLLNGACQDSRRFFDHASQHTLFDAMHVWLVVYADEPTTEEFITSSFQHLNLSVDADIAVVSSQGEHWKFTDVFNFGKIQGNNLEKNHLGTWRRAAGLNITTAGFKYYDRWDFHNLTLRAVSVVLNQPTRFDPTLLWARQFTPGVSSFTKHASQLLRILRHQHNFRFNYTIVGRWIGSPKRNSTLAVTNALYWREQDISCTCVRLYAQWLDSVDPFFPPVTSIETKFYYLIPDPGVGEYENRFLKPLSRGVWLCAGAAAVACAIALAAAAVTERHPQPALFALYSVLAAVGQQAYEDGVQILQNTFTSQGRRLAMLVLGVTSMLLYNYYTSSVVSWLLNSPAPTIASMDGLIHSDLELVFEDTGYTRGWLDNPGFYYYSGYKNPKEDELRERKVQHGRRTVPLMQTVEAGIDLVRTGAYAYHSEPYMVSRVLASRLSERALCKLGALQMMPPAQIYIMGQPRSPYRQFFVWSLLRLLERGHTTAMRARLSPRGRECAGVTPRALALGQAAPAFLLLAFATTLAFIVLAGELLYHYYESSSVSVSVQKLLQNGLHPRNLKNKERTAFKLIIKSRIVLL